MRYLTVFTAILLFGCVAATAHALQTDTHGLHAVPAPGKVVIDGDLSDWDLSGQTLMCYDVTTLKDVYSVQVSMMYNEENLYVALHWKDATPMGNSHDPRYQANKGWAGDSVQLRIKTDRISHLTAWYFAAKQEPFIGIDYGKDMTHPFGGGTKQLFRTQDWKLQDGAEMAFKKDADGRGYVQEILIPWSIITLDHKYKAGEQFSCGLELLWGEADWPVHRYADNLVEGATSREFFWTAHEKWGPVFLEKQGNLKLSPPEWQIALQQEAPKGSVQIAYTIKKDSRVTLAINDQTGKRVRNLLASAERKAGANTDYWDGLDDAGNPVAPGLYNILGLTHDGLHVNYVTSFASPGNPPWQTSDGRGAFYGDHTAPQAACSGTDALALACPMGEAGQHLIAVDLKGQRLWGLPNRVAFAGGRIALATDGKVLFVANGVGKNDTDTYKQQGNYSIWRVDLHTGKYAPWNRKDEKGDALLDLEITPTNGVANCRGIAYYKNELAVAIGTEHRILILDADTGDTKREFKDLPNDMMAIAYNPSGVLHLLADRSLFSFDAAGKISVIVKDLDEPQSVACDASNNLYISQRGSKQNVEMFSPQGKFLKTFGKTGGRPKTGFFDATGMLKPAGITVDATGRLWVTEENFSPKRTSVWNADGTLAIDLVGTTHYSQSGIINPFDPTRGFSEGVEYKIDAANQTSRPLYTLHPAVGFDSNTTIGDDTAFGSETRIVQVNGIEYLHTCKQGFNWIFQRQKDGSWKNVVILGFVGMGKNIDDPSPRNQKFNAAFKTPLFSGQFGKSFLWVDQNNDGKIAADEMQFSTMSKGECYWGQMIGEDLTLATYSKDGWNVLKPDGFTSAGVPKYVLEKVNHLAAVKGPNWEGMIVPGRDGRLYQNTAPELYAVDSTGKLLWTYPNLWCSVHGSHNAPTPGPGLLIGPSRFYGTAFINDEVGEVFYLNGNLGQNFIFTQDGLWVQSLYNDTRGWFDTPTRTVPNMSVDAMTAGGESFYGGFCKAVDGKYYTLGGSTAAVVSQITGLDSLRRFSASATVTPSDVEKAVELKTTIAAMKNQKRSYTIGGVWGSSGGAIDYGSMTDLPSVKIIGSKPLAEVRAQFDDRNLYLAYRVHVGHMLQNAGQNEKLMFKTGDAVDLMLRTDPNAKDAKPVAGDVRLLMTLREGKPIAVLYRAVVPGTPAEKREAFSSPARTVWIDVCEVVNIQLRITKTSDGYEVAAAVPRKLLGLEKLGGQTLRGDFGVLTADSSGRACTARNYWSNKSTNNTNDVPDEATISPALWGELKFDGGKDNLLN